METVEDAPQGTSIVLRLKPEDAEDQLHDYTSPWKLREIVKRYSDFITWPIRMAERPAGAGDTRRRRRGRRAPRRRAGASPRPSTR